MPNVKSNEFHLFYAVGDDEIQIESHDKKRNKDILKLAASVPDAVTILDADDAPYYLRAAVIAENVSLRFKPVLSESARRIRAKTDAGMLRISETAKVKKNWSVTIRDDCDDENGNAKTPSPSSQNRYHNPCCDGINIAVLS